MKALKCVLVRSRKNFLSFCDIWKKLFLCFSDLIFEQYDLIILMHSVLNCSSWPFQLVFRLSVLLVQPGSQRLRWSRSCFWRWISLAPAAPQRASSQLTFCPKRKRSHAIQALLSADPSVWCESPNSQKRLLVWVLALWKWVSRFFENSGSVSWVWKGKQLFTEQLAFTKIPLISKEQNSPRSMRRATLCPRERKNRKVWVPTLLLPN